MQQGSFLEAKFCDATAFQIDSRCSLTMTLAEGNYCKQKKLDPQFPTCPQVTLVGRIERVSYPHLVLEASQIFTVQSNGREFSHILSLCRAR
jgi:hypothetical protein